MQGDQALALEGKVALVTGGASGIGREIALALGEAGASLAIHYHSSRQAAQDLQHQLHQQGREARCYHADLRQTTEAEHLVPAVLSDFARLDILINNASVFHRVSAQAATDRHWQEMMQLHLHAPLKLAQAAAESLKSHNGHIINIADIWGLRPRAIWLPYCITKAATIALTYALADQLAPDVHVNAVAPGVITWPVEIDELKKQTVLDRIPLGRQGSSRDIAEAVRFLCTDGTYITGQVITVDGGRSIDWA